MDDYLKNDKTIRWQSQRYDCPNNGLVVELSVIHREPTSRISLARVERAVQAVSYQAVHGSRITEFRDPPVATPLRARLSVAMAAAAAAAVAAAEPRSLPAGRGEHDASVSAKRSDRRREYRSVLRRFAFQTRRSSNK